MTGRRRTWTGLFAPVAALAVAAGAGAQEAPAADAVDRFIRAFNALGGVPLVGVHPDGSFVRPEGGADSAVAAAFGPRAKAFAYVLGEGRFAEVDWLPEPWQYHGFGSGATLRPGHDARVTVLVRIVSGPFVLQRERLTVLDPSGQRSSTTASVIYQVRAGRIHRVWYPLAEPDPGRLPPIAAPTHASGEGPVVWMDVWHHNTATPDGTYSDLAELLRRDGYGVRSWGGPFTRTALDSVRILWIANAHPGEGRQRSGSGASAFTAAEIEALRGWVEDGGSLVLVADHDPYAGAAAELAAAFGADFRDGAARDTARANGGNILFRRGDGLLRDHPITDGSVEGERVDSVLTLLGQAFRGGPGLEPLLVLPPSTVLRLAAGGADDATPPARISAGGWLQGAAGRVGRGRVALFGEAWMFRGLHLAQNARLALNLARWLSEGPGSMDPPEG